jgi:hypothetical protein
MKIPLRSGAAFLGWFKGSRATARIRGFETVEHRKQLHPHCFEQTQILFNMLQPCLGDVSDNTPLARFSGGAGRNSRGGLMKFHQLLDFPEGETQFLTLLDEPDVIEIGVAVGAVTGSVSERLRQDSSSLVETDGLNIDPSLACQLADPHDLIVNPIPRYRVNF